MWIIANLWCRKPVLDNNTCQFCGNMYYEELIHLLAECTTTDCYRHMLYVDIADKFGADFLDELTSLDELEWSLRLLGANIAPLLDETSEIQFLRLAYKFIVKCLIEGPNATYVNIVQ